MYYTCVMSTSIVKNIVDYVDYLRNSLGLQVSFCNIARCFEPYMHILHPYNVHNNAYCECIKTHSRTLNVCVEKQFKVLERSMAGEFYGACWAGVEEYVFPIRHNDQPLGFISVSGYRGRIAQSADRVAGVAKRFGLDYDLLAARYETGLTEKVPALDALRPVIAPLCDMFELLYIKTPERSGSTDKSTSLYADILNYLCYNYTRNISLDEIAEQFHYSKSYLRQLFRRKSNHSIMHYLTALRIKRAKELLANTSMRVSEIAFEVGYSDSNYFTNIFRKETGLSPKAYRKSRNAGDETLALDKFSQ